MRKFITACVLLILAACGWHLEGKQILPGQLHHVYIASSQFDPLVKSLSDHFTAAGAILATEKENAPITFKILKQSHTQLATTVGASQQTREYALTYTVAFELLDTNGKRLAGPLSVSEQRTQVLQSSQILGASNQTEDLNDDMLKEAVNQIMAQLNSESVRSSLDKKQKLT